MPDIVCSNCVRRWGVSRSGFYDHEQKPDCERRREDGVLAQKISLLFLEGRRTNGSRRIQKGLLREGIQCGKSGSFG